MKAEDTDEEEEKLSDDGEQKEEEAPKDHISQQLRNPRVDQFFYHLTIGLVYLPLPRWKTAKVGFLKAALKLAKSIPHSIGPTLHVSSSAEPTPEE